MTTATRRADLVVIGGGAGGISAARAARRRGASVVIVQDGPVGGDCTFTGCVPSKTLLAATARGAGFDEAMSNVRATVEQIAATEDASALSRDGIDVIEGRGTVVSAGDIRVDGTTVRTDRLIVATGSRPAIPPIPGLDSVPFLTNEQIFGLDRRPESLVILGGGPIGCEMATAFARLGTTVTLVEAADRLLPRDDADAGAVIRSRLEALGVTVRTGAPATSVTSTGSSVDVTVGAADAGGEDHIDAGALLVAVGREPNGRGFGLEEIGVQLDGRGAVVVDDTLATSVSGVWAIGDVTGKMPFTHVAAAMGFAAVRNALDRSARLRPSRFLTDAIPWVTFTDPEVAQVGVTEADAPAGAKVAHLPFEAVDRAVTAGRTEGFVKFVAAPRRLTGWAGGGHLVGATIVGPTAGEMIHEAALAMSTSMFTGRLAQTTHAYPSWSMAIQQAAAQFFMEIDGRTARSVGR